MSLETTEPTVVPEVPTEEVSEVKNKHKLCRAWQLWLLCPVKEAGKKNQKAKPADSLIYDISTVEDFWAIFNNFKSPAEIAFLSERTNIILSAQEVQPKWEDPANLPGGAWSVSYSFPTSPASAPNPLVPGEHTIDKMWDATLLSVIGGTMKNHKDISSIWLKVRSHQDANKQSVGNVTIEFWNFSSDKESATSLGEEWVTILKTAGVDVNSLEFTYKTHDESIRAATGKRDAASLVKISEGSVVSL